MSIRIINKHEEFPSKAFVEYDLESAANKAFEAIGDKGVEINGHHT